MFLAWWFKADGLGFIACVDLRAEMGEDGWGMRRRGVFSKSSFFNFDLLLWTLLWAEGVRVCASLLIKA